MKSIIIFIFIISLSFNLFSQVELKVFEPVNTFSADLSKETEDEINRQNYLLAKESLTETEKKELDILIHNYGEVISSVWDVVDDGCSWYCGGGNYKTMTSSQLDSTQVNNYSSKSANDLSYKTAWVEGKADDGIGEYIEYYFENKSPRITSIKISNGYQKSESVWKNNNRVKSLKFYVNGIEFGILELSDTKTDQEFQIGTFGHNSDGSDLVLRFEILEVYKGDKYSDTAITEIYFDGIDVH